MADQDTPQIYLITPPSVDLETYPKQLAGLLNDFDIACVRIALASNDESTISRTADAVRETCHKSEVACVIDTHHRLVTPLGLDGVHLSDGGRNLRDIRKDLGQDAIIGAHCGTSKHAGMTAGEIGADYVCFGPVGQSALGSGELVAFETFEWWSQMVEIPVVAEGSLDLDTVERLAPVVDWFAFGSEIWDAPDGAAVQLGAFIKRLG
ncbi:thiamine phosphate synthase [Amylibacter ulvae]|uniref:Thiamine phosphate synthase n=1 Tax=Paramylibacter ulvae TaxID=1651968 RepID=A0ABQ3CXI3_9RHOB|nr:thiamine phosphate synthase [Amylibacter ulvae]GHA45803.1 thiamine phosphate synthase [Amylibacter ulvae]